MERSLSVRTGIVVTGITIVLAQAGCGPTPEAPIQDDAALVDASGCTDGDRGCDGFTPSICVNGQWAPQAACPVQCDDDLGCVVCTPGQGTCMGETAHVCDEDGQGYTDTYCDPDLGLACDTDLGQCTGECTPEALGRSYVGCEYFPTVTGNVVSSFDFAFAVTISNTGNDPATVTIEGGALPGQLTFMVAPGEVSIQELPWVGALNTTTSTLAVDGAYHVRSNRPVTVYEFSPLEYTNGFNFSYTNDASLLLPANVLGLEHVVAAYPHGAGGAPGFAAITAVEDDTQVTVTSSCEIPASGAVPAFTTGVPQTVTLGRLDVLYLAPGGAVVQGDMTGTRITSDKPVQVLGGHVCTFVPLDVCCCDHLEESMFPIETLSTSYVVTNPAVPSLPNGKPQVVRIIATQPSTVLTFDPPLPGVPTTIDQAGGFIDVEDLLADFVVTANHKILVAQYMEGQDAGGNTGDPALALAVPTDQYRTEYLFHAPLNYEVAYVNITAPVGTIVMVEGTPVTVSTPIGASNLGVVRHQLQVSVNGNYSATSATPFGISVYGYGQYTSYWYPGGLDLTEIPIP